MRKIEAFAMITLAFLSILNIGATIGTPPRAHAATPTLAITDVYDLNETGKTFLANLTISDINDLELWNINITFDPGHIQITTIKGVTSKGLEFPRRSGIKYVILEGDFLKSAAATTGLNINSGGKIDNATGEVNSLWDASGGNTVTGSGILAMFNFTVLNITTSQIRITESLVQSKKDAPYVAQHQVINATISNGSAPPPPPPPLWTQSWFQATIGVASAAGVIVLLVVFYRKFWKRIKQARLLRVKRDMEPIYEDTEPEI
jgi:hypothetical protein